MENIANESGAHVIDDYDHTYLLIYYMKASEGDSSHSQADWVYVRPLSGYGNLYVIDRCDTVRVGSKDPTLFESGPR